MGNSYKKKCLECGHIHEIINEKVMENGELLIYCKKCNKYTQFSRIY